MCLLWWRRVALSLFLSSKCCVVSSHGDQRPISKVRLFCCRVAETTWVASLTWRRCSSGLDWLNWLDMFIIVVSIVILAVVWSYGSLAVWARAVTVGMLGGN